MKRKSPTPKKISEPTSRLRRIDRHLLMVAAVWLFLPNMSGFLIQDTIIKSVISFNQQQLQQQILHNTQQTLQLTLSTLPERIQTLASKSFLNDAVLTSTDHSQLEEQLVGLLPLGSNVRLLNADKISMLNDDYVLLNLINQLKKGEQPPPQILQQPTGLIYRIGIALQTNHINNGFLVASIPLEPFLAALPKLEPSLGYIEITSPLARVKSLTLHKSGNPNLKQSNEPEKFTIAQLPLSVYLQIDPSTAQQHIRSSLYWLWINAASLLSFGLWLVLRKKEQIQLKNNFKYLLSNLQPNKTTREAHYNLPHFQHLEDQIKNLLLAAAQPNPSIVTNEEKFNAKTAFLNTTNNVKLDNDSAIEDNLFSNLDLNLEDTTLFDLPPTTTQHLQLPSSVFRQYDIRGIVDDTLTPELVTTIGQALGTQALKKMQSTIIIGRDGRHSSPALSKALAEGILKSGCNVLDICEVPTPLVYFATYHTEFKSGVMITGSHNPPNYNGLKMVLAGETLFGQHILDLKTIIEQQQLSQGQGHYATTNITEDYLQRATQDTILARRLKVVVDAGNGVAGPTALALLDRLGCDVIPLYCDIDGDFPHHHPDPSKPENLHTLIETVKAEHADLGIAFDGDGDRLGVVTNAGKLIYPDRLLMFFAKDILVQNPGGDIIFDVKCSSSLSRMISQWGGRPIMWKTGHSLIKAKLKETGALLAGEMSGHIFFNDRWFGFDDALYSAARLLELLSMNMKSLDEVMSEIPELVSTPEINITVSEEEKFSIIETLKKIGVFNSGKVTTLDGIRVDYPHGWGLIRASNTTPVLVARFEAETAEEMQRIRQEFTLNLAKVNANLIIPN